MLLLLELDFQDYQQHVFWQRKGLKSPFLKRMLLQAAEQES